MRDIKGDRTEELSSMPMKKLVFAMALPIMISMLVQAFYNVVDSLYVSYIPDTAAIVNASDKAVQALTLSFPIQMLMVAFNTGTGVGVLSVLSRFLGKGDRESASRVAGNAIFLGAVYYIGFMLFGIFGVNAFIGSQTQDPVTYSYAVSYLSVCTIGAFGTMGYFAFEKILQATGQTTLAMIVQLAGACANIVLDPFFIFGWCGIPAMGAKGAAVATVISQCISCVLGVYIHYRYNRAINRSVRYMIPDGKIILSVYVIAIPAIFMSAMTSLMAYGMNKILGSVSAAEVTAFGIYFKLQNFIYMPAFGLNNALVPIVGFSYGAGRKDRIDDALKWGLTDVFIIMGAGILLLQCFAPQITGIFAVSEEVQIITVKALRIITIGYFFAGANVILQGYCQALGNGVYSLIISLLRMAALLLPLVWLFVKSGYGDLLWAAFPIAELCALFFAVFSARHLTKKRFA